MKLNKSMFSNFFYKSKSTLIKFADVNIRQGIPLQHYLFLSAALFTIGVLGVLYRRNAIIIFMSIELMLNAVNLLLVAFSAFSVQMLQLRCLYFL